MKILAAVGGVGFHETYGLSQFNEVFNIKAPSRVITP
jgi:hypothetical protein